MAEIPAPEYRPKCLICGQPTLTKAAGKACRKEAWPVHKEHF